MQDPWHPDVLTRIRQDIDKIHNPLANEVMKTDDAAQLDALAVEEQIRKDRRLQQIRQNMWRKGANKKRRNTRDTNFPDRLASLHSRVTECSNNRFKYKPLSICT